MRLEVLGDPVEHSLSPLLHTTALRHCGLAGTYEAHRVDGEGMKRAVEDIRRGGLDGANVTMPHKRLAHDLCDRLSEEAIRTGAVNTLVRVADEVIGHNTDVPGMRRAWSWAGLPGDVPVAVYGAGGAAAAALLAINDMDVRVRARRPEASEALVSKIGHGVSLPWGPPEPGTTVVNATPIGMRGEAMPNGWLDDISGLLDMAYGAQLTPAVTSARARGVPVAEGVDLLLAQAVVSFWLWTGRTAPLDAMRTAVCAVGRTPTP